MLRLVLPALAIAALTVPVPVAFATDGERLDALVRAYPDHLVTHDGTALIWRDGTRMPVSVGDTRRSFRQMLRSATILDQIRLAYPRGPLLVEPAVDDPGRMRHRAFFDKMYGDCRRGEVARRLVRVVWMPKTWGGTVTVTSVNGIDEKAAAISRELDELPDAIKAFAYPPGGSYSCRTVADTGEPSMHARGAAIDIGIRHADYWLWRRTGGGARGFVNRIPYEIVAIFERHGFIWGGKWASFDTMHFEYRPELLDGD